MEYKKTDTTIEIIKSLYKYKGSVGTTLVALTIWVEFGVMDTLLFLGIVLMITGVITIIAKSME